MITKAQQLGKKKTNIKKLKKKLEVLVKQEVRERDNYICQHCGKNTKGSDCHVSHVIPVSGGHGLAYDPMNMKVLCYHCHLNWWHKSPIEAGNWFCQKFPDRWAYLQTVERKRKWTAWELEEEIKKYG